MFEQKNISVPKLYYRLSKQTEKILLIFGTIGSPASGVSGPLMTQLFGGTIDDASSMSEIELDNFFEAFQKTLIKCQKN